MSYQLKIKTNVFIGLLVWVVVALAAYPAMAQIKYVYSLDFPVGQKDAYFEWVATVSEVMNAPPEIRRIVTYENYFGASPHRFIEFEFDDAASAARYFARPEVNQVLEEVVNQSRNGQITVLKQKGEFVNS